MNQEFLFPYLGVMTFPGRSPKNYDARLRRLDWWDDITPRIRRRAGGYCERCCKRSRSLDVHHLTYERFWHERDDDLQALCRPCHVVADRQRRRANRSRYRGDSGEESWCSQVFGEDPGDWPDDAAERFASWVERKG